jgi:hypothetical protein
MKGNIFKKGLYAIRFGKAINRNIMHGAKIKPRHCISFSFLSLPLIPEANAYGNWDRY